MSGAAARGHRKATRTPDAGLLTAWRRCELIPDPPGLEGVAATTGRNSGCSPN